MVNALEYIRLRIAVFFELPQRNNQRGIALITSLLLIVVMTIVGLSAASKARLLQITSTSAVRYDEITHIAEAEIYRLINALQQSDDIIAAGKGAVMDGGTFKRVWSNQALAEVFSSKGLPDFSDFRHSGWAAAHNNGFRRTFTPIAGSIRSSYGSVTTEAFVQQLMQKSFSHYSGKNDVETHYLITVKAFAQNPGDSSEEREIVVLQSVYSISVLR